ncbi:MAG: thioredoxin-dependent thiol peroxidase [Chloroflexota bacterium]
MTELKEGDTAPDFTLSKSGGGDVTLSDLHGTNVVLYFYPKDDTTGCTKEACSFRDNHAQFEGANAVVLGISPDSVPSHDQFIAKYGLPFTLVADPDHAVSEKYGAWTQRSNYGRKYMGIQRSTFLIGPDGLIEKVWPDVKVDGHVEAVLNALGA